MQFNTCVIQMFICICISMNYIYAVSYTHLDVYKRQVKQYEAIKTSLSKRLDEWMKASHDPRRDGKGDEIDRYESTTHAWITSCLLYTSRCV